MNITVYASPAILRGTPFAIYASVLHNLIGERYGKALNVDEIDIVQAEPTAMLFDRQPADDDEAREILAMARTITSPAAKNGYFG